MQVEIRVNVIVVDSGNTVLFCNKYKLNGNKSKSKYKSSED